MTLTLLFAATACSKGDDTAVTKDLTGNGVYTATGTVARETTGGDDSGVGDGSSFRLRVWCADEDYEMIGAMLKNYESKYYKNTYNFVLERVGEDIAASRVLQDVSAAADVFSFANDQIGTLIKNSALTQVPSRYVSQIESQISVAQQAASLGGNYYAIPYSYENCFLYYNKSKITDVTSLDGILNASIAGVSYNLGIDMGDSYYTTSFLYTAGVQIFGPNGDDASAATVRGSLNNDAAKKACKFIQSLYNKKKLDSIDKNDQAAALQSGKVAAIISGPHMISAFKDALGENFAVAMLPSIRFPGDSSDSQLVSFSGVKMYGISRKSSSDRDQKTTDEAIRLAAYLANSENQEIRLEEREFCPTDEVLFEAALDSGIDTVKVVVSQSKYSKLKPGLIEMSNYWEPMGSFLIGVYKNQKDESTWEAELVKVENKIMPVSD